MSPIIVDNLSSKVGNFRVLYDEAIEGTQKRQGIKKNTNKIWK